MCSVLTCRLIEVLAHSVLVTLSGNVKYVIVACGDAKNSPLEVHSLATGVDARF